MFDKKTVPAVVFQRGGSDQPRAKLPLCGNIYSGCPLSYCPRLPTCSQTDLRVRPPTRAPAPSAPSASSACPVFRLPVLQAAAEQ